MYSFHIFKEVMIIMSHTRKTQPEIFRLIVFTGEFNKGNNSGDKLQCIDWGLFLSHLGLQCG